MRLWVGLVLVLVPMAGIAQQRGAYANPMGSGGQSGIYGGQTGQRGMYGGISTGQMVGTVNDPGFAGRLGATVSGLPQTTTRIPVQRPRSWGNPGHGGRTVVVPYGVPVLYGSGYSYAEQPVQTIVQPVQPAPSVIINQYYTPESANPEMKEYANLPEPIRAPRTEVEQGSVRVTPPSALAPRTPAAARPQLTQEAIEAANRPTITTLVFADGSKVPVIAYWRQGDSLHYVGADYSKVVVPLDSFDKAASERANAERGVEFRLDSVR